MMDAERLKAEKLVLEKKLPSNAFRFLDMDADTPYIVIAAKTNRGNLYTLRIDLELFPESIPNMFVVNKLDKNSKKLFHNSILPIHTIECEKGLMLLDYITSWSPMISLYSVYNRGKLWLEMFENQK